MSKFALAKRMAEKSQINESVAARILKIIEEVAIKEVSSTGTFRFPGIFTINRWSYFRKAKHIKGVLKNDGVDQWREHVTKVKAILVHALAVRVIWAQERSFRMARQTRMPKY